ncbi:alpha/beta-hydrolase, partial [Aureobasidium melanogenum]
MSCSPGSDVATNIPKLYKMLEFFGFETGAFSQLTQKYMRENFNPKTPDREGIAYYSYGATVNPRFWSMFRQSHRIIQRLEGDNDGLVSVQSSKWGTYKGTLKDVSHLDMINWTNRLRWFLWELTGNKRNFNAIAFYLDIAGQSSEHMKRTKELSQQYRVPSLEIRLGATLHDKATQLAQSFVGLSAPKRGLVSGESAEYPLPLLAPLLVSICKLLMLCASDTTGAGMRYSLAGPMVMFLVAGEEVSEDRNAAREVVAKVERGIGEEREKVAEQSVDRERIDLPDSLNLVCVDGQDILLLLLLFWQFIPFADQSAQHLLPPGTYGVKFGAQVLEHNITTTDQVYSGNAMRLVGMLELAEDNLLSIGAEVDEAGLPVRMPEGTPVVKCNWQQEQKQRLGEGEKRM